MAPTATSLPTPSPAVLAGGTGEANETFFDPTAPPSEQDALPVAPAGDTGPSGPSIPEQNNVIVSYAGQVVPVLALPDGISTGPAIAHGDIFAVSGIGQIAAVDPSGELYVGGTPVRISPASEFGLHPNLSYGDLAWSPNGQYLALRVDAADPQAFNGIDSGVWIYEPTTNQSWQIFRNTFEGQVAQRHEQRRALRVKWAPNNSAVIVTVSTPMGQRIVFMPVKHSANEWIDALAYANATWTTDSSGLIVSGQTGDGYTVVGHIALDTDWTYTEYLNQNTTGLYMRAAIQLRDRRIAFLGGTGLDTVALYTIQPTPNAQPDRVSQLISGRVVSTEWNAERTALLVTLQTDGGRRLQIVRTDGAVQNVTPTGGSFSDAHWR